MAEKISREYFFDKETRTIFFANTGTLDVGYEFMGMSDNPNPKMAAAVFMQLGKKTTGCKVKEYIKN